MVVPGRLCGEDYVFGPGCRLRFIDVCCWVVEFRVRMFEVLLLLFVRVRCFQIMRRFILFFQVIYLVLELAFGMGLCDMVFDFPVVGFWGCFVCCCLWAVVLRVSFWMCLLFFVFWCFRFFA